MNDKNLRISQEAAVIMNKYLLHVNKRRGLKMRLTKKGLIDQFAEELKEKIAK